jgi:hypothetical protein
MATTLKDEAVAHIASLDKVGIVHDGVGKRQVRVMFPARTSGVDALARLLHDEYGATTIDQNVIVKPNGEVNVTWDVYWENPERVRDSLLQNTLKAARSTQSGLFNSETIKNLCSSPLVTTALVTISVVTLLIRVWEPIFNSIAYYYSEWFGAA